VELVRDFGDELQGEALDLIGESATKASQLLQFYRVAFGSARATDGSGIGLEEARQRVLTALSSERISIRWSDEGSIGNEENSRLAVKLILNLVLLGVEILPGAGEICVEITQSPLARVQITANKNGINLRENLAAVLNGEVSPDELTPGTVQAFFTRFLANSVGGGIKVQHGNDHISLVVEF
jgi:histidine phosphotransferase ChpT